nr:hypothetical protein [Tanacetum cinerariifolium]
MLRWTCGKTMIDMIPNGVYRSEIEVKTIINKIREVSFSAGCPKGSGMISLHLTSLLVLDKIVDEPLVLYAGLVVEEMCKIVEQLVKVVEESLKIVDDTEMDCNEVDDCCSKDVCFVIVVPRTPIVPY